MAKKQDDDRNQLFSQKISRRGFFEALAAMGTSAAVGGGIALHAKKKQDQISGNRPFDQDSVDKFGVEFVAGDYEENPKRLSRRRSSHAKALRIPFAENSGLRIFSDSPVGQHIQSIMVTPDFLRVAYDNAQEKKFVLPYHIEGGREGVPDSFASHIRLQVLGEREQPINIIVDNLENRRAGYLPMAITVESEAVPTNIDVSKAHIQTTRVNTAGGPHNEIIGLDEERQKRIISSFSDLQDTAGGMMKGNRDRNGALRDGLSKTTTGRGR